MLKSIPWVTDGQVARAGISVIWNVLSWSRGRVWTLVGSNLGCEVLLSKSYLIKICQYIEHSQEKHGANKVFLFCSWSQLSWSAVMWCKSVVSRGAVRSAASSYAAMRMVAGSRPALVIAWEWHIGLALLCGCSGALEYPTINSCGPINKSLS